MEVSSAEFVAVSTNENDNLKVAVNILSYLSILSSDYGRVVSFVYGTFQALYERNQGFLIYLDRASGIPGIMACLVSSGGSGFLCGAVEQPAIRNNNNSEPKTGLAIVNRRDRNTLVMTEASRMPTACMATY